MSSAVLSILGNGPGRGEILYPIPTEDSCKIKVAGPVSVKLGAPAGNGSASAADIAASVAAGVIVTGKTELALGELLGSSGVLGRPSPDLRAYAGQDEAAKYQAAADSYAAGDIRGATMGFVLAGTAPERCAASLYGAALCLSASGCHKDALKLAIVLDEAEFPHPGALALAGHAAFKLGQSKSARGYLARAARIARADTAYQDVLKFAQRTLLAEQFSGG